MLGMQNSLRLAALLVAGLLLGAVPASAAPKQSRMPTPGGAAPAGRLPVSLLELMRASVEIPADGIWAAEGSDKLSEEEWQLADQDAVNLIVASALMAHAGTGRNDAKWVATADWQAWVRDMGKTSRAIRGAVKAMDQKRMATAADHLQELCEACHTKYRPKAPSDGVSRYPFYPKRELAK
jgi:hypothetical protein